MSVGVPGKVLHSQAREIVANVIKFMREEAKGARIPLTKFRERVLAATKIGDFSYRKITKEMKQMRKEGIQKFSSPKKNTNRPRPKSNLHEGQLERIRSIIHNYYIIEKRVPTLKGIHNKIVESGIGFNGGVSTLSTIIKKLGFRWCQTKGKKILMESHEIRLKRIEYLQQLQKHVQNKRPIIFTDESYINSNHTNKNSRSDHSVHGLKKPVGKGQHAGGSQGLIENGLRIFKSDGNYPSIFCDNIYLPAESTTEDYHSKINHVKFMQWVNKQLLPNLPERAVLVVDNASYHDVVLNKDPTFLSLKQVMVEWLAQRGIPHDPNATKPVLYKLIKENKAISKQYVLDTELAKNGHLVLRLPPYHWELIQLMASKNLTFSLKDIINLGKEKSNSITTENWAKICTHVNKIIEEYMEKEHLLDRISDEFQFTVDTVDSEGEDDWYSEDEEMEDANLEDQEAGPSTI